MLHRCSVQAIAAPFRPPLLRIYCFNSFGFCGFGRLMAIRKAGGQSSSAYFKSSPPMRSDICQGGNEFSTSKKLLSKEVEAQGPQTYQPRSSTVLRPGMVLLRRFLTLDEQVLTVRECRCLLPWTRGFLPAKYAHDANVPRFGLGFSIREIH